MNPIECVKKGDEQCIEALKNTAAGKDPSFLLLCEIMRAEIIARRGEFPLAARVIESGLIKYGKNASIQVLVLAAICYIGTEPRKERYLKILSFLPRRVKQSQNPLVFVMRHAGHNRSGHLARSPRGTIDLSPFINSHLLLVRRAFLDY